MTEKPKKEEMCRFNRKSVTVDKTIIDAYSATKLDAWLKERVAKEVNEIRVLAEYLTVSNIREHEAKRKLQKKADALIEALRRGK